MKVGEIYKSNFWGDIEIVEYVNNRNVTIRFIESGNIHSVQKHEVLKGLVKDMTRQKEITADKRRQEKVLTGHKNKIADLNKQIRVAHMKYHTIVCTVKKTLKRFVNHVKRCIKITNRQRGFIYKRRVHPKYGEYRLVAKGKRKGSFVVEFIRTGFQIECVSSTLKTNNVRDYSQFSKEQEKDHWRSVNAQSYLDNREEKLQQSKDWQKRNPEKSSVRNRNRRARRVGAEGTHTREEADQLLKDQDNKCNCCGITLDEGKHLDHIMPLILGGSNWIENLQWLCVFCNSSKSGKHPDLWNKIRNTTEYQERRKKFIL